MLITVVTAGGVEVVVLGVVVALAGAARRTRSVTLTASVFVRGDELVADGEQRFVVRRVLRDITRSHVVLVRPWRWWHRWRWTRGWL